ncbi:hypothetical protein C7H79_15200 [Nitrosomonas supralitoralis]|uniref:Uncharacterized protein n=1 Tax=Nitrosomonas supralitoralis TaxID=2116706 RepID=A0A2P7NRQ6_9PROT|nr:hypothetical protein C7H79_15200 [Nitrosomonas supralitoralis]
MLRTSGHKPELSQAETAFLSHQACNLTIYLNHDSLQDYEVSLLNATEPVEVDYLNFLLT